MKFCARQRIETFAPNSVYVDREWAPKGCGFVKNPPRSNPRWQPAPIKSHLRRLPILLKLGVQLQVHLSSQWRPLDEIATRSSFASRSYISCMIDIDIRTKFGRPYWYKNRSWGLQMVKIYFRPNARWRTAPTLKRWNGAADCSILLCYAMHDDREPASWIVIKTDNDWWGGRPQVVTQR